jgi:type II secretory pathway component PulF
MSEQESTVPVPTSAWVFPSVIHGIVGLAVFARLLVGGPQAARTFKEFNMALPRMTEAFLMLSFWINDNLMLWATALVALYLLDAMTLWMLDGWSRAEGKTWFGVVVALLLITWGLLEVSLLLASWKLQEALSR